MAFTISLAQLPNYPEGPTDQGDVSTPASTSEIPDFCKSNLRKNKKVDKCCKEVEKIQSSGGSLCPTPKPCTIEKCGRVCNRYFSQMSGCNVSPKPEDECDKGKKQKHEKPPKQNNYPSGPDDVTEATKPPKGGKASSKPPKQGYPSGPDDVTEATKPPKGGKASSKPPKQGYPSGPDDVTEATKPPKGGKASAKPPKQGYPSGPDDVTEATKPPKGGKASAKPPKQGYPSGPDDVTEATKPPKGQKASARPPKQVYPSGPESVVTTEQPGYPEGPAETKKPSEKNKYTSAPGTTDCSAEIVP
uniref:Uncharacterized protein n=1 Tax=Meloidogyne incognita TaxID=6306 RepID=A0A914MSX3_MELIC